MDALTFTQDKMNDELHTAVCTGNIKDAIFWIQKGAEINTGNFLLQTAATHGNEEIVALLIKHGATVNAKNATKETALMSAAKHGRTKIVILLLENHADVNLADFAGYTALHQSAYKGYVDIVDLLIRNGANIYARDHMHQTALEWSNYEGDDICDPDAALRILREMTPEERNHFANSKQPSRQKLVARFDELERKNNEYEYTTTFISNITYYFNEVKNYFISNQNNTQASEIDIEKGIINEQGPTKFKN